MTTDSDFSSTINTKLAVFIVFIIAIVVGYLILWTPFVNRLNRDVSIVMIEFLIDLEDQNDVDYNSDTDHYENSKDSRVP